MKNDDIKIVKRFFKIDLKELAFFKFIIESYEGLAMQRTLNAKRGEIEVMVPACNELEFNVILNDLKRDIFIVEIKKPVDYTELII
jgi:hypothetical protein